jgi:GrpB-like predicted nucleotidyltransferase (UPF0157 family)
MSLAPVAVVPYDSRWPALYAAERDVLCEVLAPWLVGGIEHVGSTAVPELAAKPIIDIMVGVQSLAASEPAKQVLAQHGYQYADYKTDVMHWFCKPSSAFRTHHLHLIPHGSPLWHERLAFRDLLRRSAEVRRQYAELKRGLARVHHHDREAYTQAKWPFIARALQRASAAPTSRKG